jgi:hypothetical protein
VVAANADISTSDALQIARNIDPKGTRTIGVITKIDIMDRGTNAKTMLLGTDIPLKLGYVGIKGRSNQDIKDGVTVKKGLEEERKFFASHSVYSTMPPGHTGTDSLTQKLTKILYAHIRTYLPEIYKEILGKMAECEERLKDLGTPLPKNDSEKLHVLWEMTTNFCENFKNQVRGKYDMKHFQVKTELSGAAKIRSMFNEVYEDYTPGSKFRATSTYTDRDIQKAIFLHEGDSIPGFPSLDAFLSLLQPQLEKIKEPALDLVNSVYAYLEEVAVGLIGKLFYRFPMLIGDFQDMVCKYMQLERDKARIIVECIVDAEQGYLFTNDMDYITNRTNIVSKEKPQSMDPEKILITELRNRIDAYFAIVLRNVRDSVPKAVGHFLVRATQDNLQFSLYNHINKSQTFKNLLSEPANVTMERETMQNTLDVLRKAARLLKTDIASNLSGNDDDEVPSKPQANTKRIESQGSEKSMTSTTNTTKMTVTEPTTKSSSQSFLDFSDQKQPQNPSNLTVQNQGGNPTQSSPTQAKTTTTSNSIFGGNSNSIFGSNVPTNQNIATQPKVAGTNNPANNSFPSAGGNNPFAKKT